MHLSIVSPVYRAEQTLDELVRRIIITVSTITSDFEIILVDDGSPDDSWNVIEKIRRNEKRVKGIQLTRNFGQHQAITCGLDCARGDWVVIMDCDLQDKPEEIRQLFFKAQEGFDVVLARRVNRQDGIITKLFNKIFYKIFNFLTDTKYNHQVGVFRIVSKKVVENFRLLREQNRFFYGLIEWLGFPTTSVSVEHSRRSRGKSNYTFSKLFRLATDIVLSYSDKPLKILVISGLVISLLAFCFGIFIIWRALVYGSPVTGWASLIVSLYFLSGLIVTVLGIVGLYLGKTFSEVKKRPLYVISKKAGFVADEKFNPKITQLA